MLNLIQHLTKSTTYETLKQVQGDRLGLFTSPSEKASKEDPFDFIPYIRKGVFPLSGLLHFQIQGR